MNSLSVCLSIIASLSSVSAMDMNAKIAAKSDSLRAASNANEREIEMNGLMEMLLAADQREIEMISDDSVSEIAKLLDIDGVNGKFYGSRALGAIGCRAKSSLPKLRVALESAQPVGSSFGSLTFGPPVDSRQKIEAAIRMIENAAPCP